jgi:hypothetical protein
LKSEDRISMVETRGKRHRVGLIGIIILSVALPACHSPGEPPAPWIRQPDSRNVAFRPAYDAAGYRPFVIGGYAGASYAPGIVGRRALIGPPASLPPGQPAVTVNQGTWEPE